MRKQFHILLFRKLYLPGVKVRQKENLKKKKRKKEEEKEKGRDSEDRREKPGEGGVTLMTLCVKLINKG